MVICTNKYIYTKPVYLSRNCDLTWALCRVLVDLIVLVAIFRMHHHRCFCTRVDRHKRKRCIECMRTVSLYSVKYGFASRDYITIKKISAEKYIAQFSSKIGVILFECPGLCPSVYKTLNDFYPQILILVAIHRREPILCIRESRCLRIKKNVFFKGKLRKSFHQ